MDNNPPLVTIFGGSGFLGRYIARRMARAGWRVRVAVRRPNEAMYVMPYGEVGQVVPVLANIRDEASTMAAIKGADAVVNCVGILAESGKQKFDVVHSRGARRVAKLAAKAGVSRLVHISSLSADAESQSAYARSKAKGDTAVLAAFPGAVVLRPSVLFGSEDRFFNMFGTMSRYFPVIPVVGANTRFQPVFVDDVAAAVEKAITGDVRGIFELGGPEIDTFRGLMQRMLKIVRRRKPVINIPFGLARINAFFIEMWHKFTLGIVPLVLTRDQVKQLRTDNVVGDDARTLQDLGVRATSIDAVLESYLYRFRSHGQFTDITASAKNLRG